MSLSDSPIGRLFSGVWSVVVFLYRTIVVLSLVVLVTIVWMGVQQRSAPLTLENNLALALNPEGDIVDTVDEDPSEQLLREFSGEGPTQVPLRDLVDALQRASTDPRIAMAVVKLDRTGAAGIPQMEEFAAAMQTFRKAGKKIYAWGPYFEQNHYLAVAEADRISIDPLGVVLLEGFSAYQNYFKDALDKLGINVHIFRVGEYKSAVEPFERNDMSAEAKEANREWLGDLWKAYTESVAHSRQLPPDAVDRFVSTMPEAFKLAGGDAAKVALNGKWVDAIETLEQFRAEVGKTVGMDKDRGSFRQVHYSEYLEVTDRERVASDSPRVALVAVQGDIVDGESEPGFAGGDTISELLREARDDASVKAVVLRVNSPGGSVFASEQIRREVQALRKAGKPVVASMSTLAASGGYWVSMDADRIYAHETTITGSIGIFGLLPTIEKPLEKMGIHTDGVGTTPLAGALRLDRPLSPAVVTLIQSQVDHGYRQFIDGVAKGRKLTTDKVEALARGRVWSGVDAKALGLVDAFGDLQMAADEAARLAQLSPGYRLEEMVPEYELPLERLLRFAGSSRFGFENLGLLLPEAAAPLLAGMRSTRWIRDSRGLYAHCLCEGGRVGR